MTHHRSYQIRYTGESRCPRQKWIPAFAGKARQGCRVESTEGFCALARSCRSSSRRARRIRPGGYSPGHTHPKSAFIYATVIEGAIRSQVNDGPVTTCKAGESFSELPGDRHGVTANASKTKPAKLLTAFVVDTNETELTIPFAN